MMITTTTADSVLKSYYLGAVSDQLNKSANPFLARIRQTTEDVWGKDVRKLVRFGVQGGISAKEENGDLPHTASGGYAVFVSGLKNLYGQIEVSDKAIRASANREGAFVSILNDAMDSLVQSSVYNFGRMLFGDGSGCLATMASVSGNKFVLDSVKSIVEGMIVDIYNGNSLIAGNKTVEAVDRETNTVTLSGATITSPAGYKVYVQGSKGMELTGLGAIFDTESPTLYGVTRSTSTWLTPYIKKEVGELTENEIQKAIDEVEERSGSKVNFILCSWGVRRALFSILSQYRQAEMVELEGGFRAITFNGIPVVADRFCPEGTMYLLNTDDFAIHQLCDWQWMQGDNGSILKPSATKASYSATLVKYAELMCYRPCGQAMLSGITEK